MRPQRKLRTHRTGELWRLIASSNLQTSSLPEGMIEGSATLAYGQTMAFTTPLPFQLFNIFNARSDDRSAFHGRFTNRWLWGAVVLLLLLPACVVYAPFMQGPFSTVSLSSGD